ncbi:MAG: hypothetical protein K8R34_16855 [Methanosarcinales archaeon]|nr:hypothetical protein [Methanosarcinales archaeon]
MSESQNFMVFFPRVPDEAQEKYSYNDLSLRPFGLFKQDLDIDFNQKIHPILVTQILQCCTQSKNEETPEQSFFWNLKVGKRIECLLTIAALSSGLSIILKCFNEACNERIEVDISPGQMVSLFQEADEKDQCTVKIESEQLVFRKPTGSDQLEWANTSFKDENEVIRTMIRTLIVDESASFNQHHPVSDDWIKSVEGAMEEIDPLVNFSLRVCCPYCEKESNFEINLEEIILRKLHEDQLNLLKTVHRIASYYHWTEEQIFSLPSWRRSHYLGLIEKEADQ